MTDTSAGTRCEALISGRASPTAKSKLLVGAGGAYISLERDELLARTARLLADGKVVGWFNGRMEFGPRALGARSILSDPRSPRMQAHLNLKIKLREGFRPFAPSVLRERASQLGGLSYWRGHAVAPCVLGGLGTAFVAAGTLAPDRLRPVHRAWMAMGRGAAKITTPIVLGVVYFLVITPIGLVMRLFGRNPLRHRERDDGFWVSMQSEGRSDLDRQF